jgi:aldose 1-epimerase
MRPVEADLGLPLLPAVCHDRRTNSCGEGLLITETLRLEAGPLSAEIVPSLGGGLARFDLASARGAVEIFRARRDGAEFDPNALGLYVLAPWSNRISGGGFSFGGAFHPLIANVVGEALPIHGDAWQAPWRIEGREKRRVRMSHVARGLGPFSYRAQLDYQLFDDRLAVRLEIANQASAAVPYGAGFHPWLPRTAGTRLRAPARSVWLEDERHLPTESVASAARPDWDFTHPRALPAGRINNAFRGWDGRATVWWDDRDVALDILASSPIDTYIVYSPGAEASFFCFEPVTHAVDAHNLAPGPEVHGLRVLAPGASLVAQCEFKVRSGPTEAPSATSNRAL